VEECNTTRYLSNSQGKRDFFVACFLEDLTSPAVLLSDPCLAQMQAVVHKCHQHSMTWATGQQGEAK